MKWSERSDVRRNIGLLLNVCSSFQFYVCDYNNKGVRASMVAFSYFSLLQQHTATAVTVKLYWIRRFDLEEGEDLQHSILDVKTTTVKWVFGQATSSSLNIQNCWRVDVGVTCQLQLKSSPYHRSWTVYFKSRTTIIRQDCSSVIAPQWNFYFESRTSSQQSSQRLVTHHVFKV